MMRTSNPVLNDNAFSGSYAAGEAMTIQGTVNKTMILLFILTLGAFWVWQKFIGMAVSPETNATAAAAIAPFLLIGVLGGFALAIVTVFKRQWAAITSPLYAACEGLVLGGISALTEMQYPGIVMQAVGLTFGVLFCLLAVYKSGIIKATENFKLGVVAATGGIALFYFVEFILSFFHITVPAIHQSGWIGIGFSLFVVVIASLNLVLDFDFIEKGSQQGAPKYMEWYAAFGLMVTLIWLYLEILRLLTKLNSRRD